MSDDFAGDDPAAAGYRLAQQYEYTPPLRNVVDDVGDYLSTSAQHLTEGFNEANRSLYNATRQAQQDFGSNPDWKQATWTAVKNSPLWGDLLNAAMTYQGGRVPTLKPPPGMRWARAEGGEIGGDVPYFAQDPDAQIADASRVAQQYKADQPSMLEAAYKLLKNSDYTQAARGIGEAATPFLTPADPYEGAGRMVNAAARGDYSGALAEGVSSLPALGNASKVDDAMRLAKNAGMANDIPKSYANAYELGKTYKALQDKGHSMEDIEYGRLLGKDQRAYEDILFGDSTHNAFFEMGRQGNPMPEPARGWRWGKAPSSGRSHNFPDDMNELGVSFARVDHPSVADYEWAPINKPPGGAEYYNGYLLHGVRGSDNEPLMVGLKPTTPFDVSAPAPAPVQGSNPVDDATRLAKGIIAY